MASSRVPEREVQEEPRRAATANLDLCLHKYSMLIIIGRSAHLRQTGHISGEIERGTFTPTRPLQPLYVALLFYMRIKIQMPVSSPHPNHHRGCCTDTIAVFMQFSHPTGRGCVIWRCSTISITSPLWVR